MKKRCLLWLIFLVISPAVWCQELLVSVNAACKDLPLVETELNIVRLKNGVMAFKHRIHFLDATAEALQSDYMPFEYIRSRQVTTNTATIDYFTVKMYPPDGIGEPYETEFIIKKDAFKKIFAFQYKFNYFFEWAKLGGELDDVVIEKVLKEAKLVPNITAKQGKLYVRDRDGDIYIDGQKVNKLPVKLWPGDYEVKQCKEGYRESTKKVSIKAGKFTEITLPMVKKHGVLNIDVFPKGADVWIDAQKFEVALKNPQHEVWKWDHGLGKGWNHSRLYIGKSPIMGLTPLTGGYDIVIEKEGYTPIRKEVYINDGDVININDTVVFPETVKIYTKPFITSLQIDGKYVGKSPWTGELNTGSHKVHVTTTRDALGNVQSSSDFIIEVEANGRNSFTLDAECSQIHGLNGRNYKTVRIGNQCWMAEDYKPFEENKSEGGISGVQTNSLKVNSSRDICVALGGGWHMPYRSDWKALLKYVGNNPGSKLRSSLKSGIDSYNFNALGNIVDSKAYYYTCKSKKADDLGVYMFSEFSDEIQYIQDLKGISEDLRLIRCVKDLEP